MDQQELVDWYEQNEAFASMNSQGRITLINVWEESTGFPQRLGEATDLEELSIFRSGKCQDLAPVKGFSKLRFIDIFDIPGHCLDVLLTLPRFENLSISFKEEADQGLEFIGQVSTLEILNLSNSPAIQDRHLASLSHLSSLKKLSIFNTAIGPGISFVQNLPQLEVLQLTDTNVSDNDLEAISKCRTLKLLSLPIGFTDVGMQKLVPLQELDWLGIRGEFTSAGVQSLSQLEKLRSLTFLHSKFSEGGLEELAQLQNLEYILLDERHVSKAEIKKLRKKMPHCEIGSVGSKKKRE